MWNPFKKKGSVIPKVKLHNPFNGMPIFGAGVPTTSNKPAEDLSRLDLRGLAHKQRYNPYVVRYLSILDSLVLGKSGFILDMKITNKSGVVDTKLSNRVEADFNKWAKKVSTCGRYNLRELTATLLNDQLLYGESFIEKVFIDGLLKYHVHSINSIDEDYTDERSNIYSGIKYSDYNEALAYFIKVGDGRKEIPTENITHLYKSRSATEFRGTTTLAPIINLLKDLDKFNTAVLDQQIIQASNSITIQKREEGAVLEDGTFDTDAYGNAITQDNSLVKTVNSRELNYLPTGFMAANEAIGGVSPSNSSYVAGILKRIASGFNIPYHAMTGDLSESSFSSLKFNSLLESAHFGSIQTLYTELFRMVVLDWVKQYSLKSIVSLDSLVDAVNIQAYQLPELEPLKSGQVNELELELGLTSKTKILAKRGETYEEILKDKEKEAELDIIYNNTEPETKPETKEDLSG